MIELFKYHLRFLKNPTKTLLEEYPGFSVRTGVGVFMLYLGYVLLANPKQSQITYDLLSVTFDVYSFSIVYAHAIISIILSIISHYWIIPFFLKFLVSDNVMDDGDSYRKIIFLSVLPYVIFFVIILLPLKLIAVLLLALDLSILVVVIKLVEGFVGIWLLVLIVQALIMRWNGLKEAYELSNVKVFALMFLLPIIASIPTVLIY